MLIHQHTAKEIAQHPGHITYDINQQIQLSRAMRDYGFYDEHAPEVTVEMADKVLEQASLPTLPETIAYVFAHAKCKELLSLEAIAFHMKAFVATVIPGWMDKYKGDEEKLAKKHIARDAQCALVTGHADAAVAAGIAERFTFEYGGKTYTGIMVTDNDMVKIVALRASKKETKPLVIQ